MIYFMNLCLLVLFSTAQSELVSSRCSYRDAMKKPEDASQIAMIEQVPVLESCLITCDQDVDCKSFVYEETTRRCFLYSTTVGALSLLKGQTAVSKLLDRCIRITRPGNILFYISANQLTTNGLGGMRQTNIF